MLTIGYIGNRNKKFGGSKCEGRKLKKIVCRKGY